MRYRSGTASYLDLLDAQRSLSNARQAAVQANVQRLHNLATVYRVLGGGLSATQQVPAGTLVSPGVGGAAKH